MLCDEFILKSSVFDGKLKSWSDFSYLWEYMAKRNNVEKKNKKTMSPRGVCALI